MIDYGLHARQVALPELGARGQQALGETPVDLSALPAIAQELHTRAGGVLAEHAAVRVGPPDVPALDATAPAALSLGVAAWGCVESARRVLAESSRAMPDALVARLDPHAITSPMTR